MKTISSTTRTYTCKKRCKFIRRRFTLLIPHKAKDLEIVHETALYSVMENYERKKQFTKRDKQLLFVLFRLKPYKETLWNNVTRTLLISQLKYERNLQPKNNCPNPDIDGYRHRNKNISQVIAFKITKKVWKKLHW